MTNPTTHAPANGTRNPFGAEDVPNPNDDAVTAFAEQVALAGSADDDNAAAWAPLAAGPTPATPNGYWSSRWNGGADPTIAGDSAATWKAGNAETRLTEDRIYILFDWDGGARRGLIDARRDGTRRLVGKYINLTSPEVTRPWIGLIVSNDRIDGRWTNGRLDFRR